MKKLNIILLGIMIAFASCADLDQSPENIAESDSLTDFAGVLNAAYNYHTGSATPLGVMGDYRADNIIFDEAPHTSFHTYNGDVIQMDGDFFTPIYIALYKSILSANNVIENSDVASQIAEAKFLRALSYFKLVQVFGDVSVNLSANPSITDTSILVRQPKDEIYTSVIIPDLTDAIAGLDNTGFAVRRATKIAAQGILGKVYVHIGEFDQAVTQLSSVITGASTAGIELEANFSDIFAADLSKEILFCTQISSSIAISEYTGTNFADWYAGGDTKGDEDPITQSLIDAYDAETDVIRRNATIDDTGADAIGVKYTAREGAENDWIELRLGDAILLYAEALNEEGSTPDAIIELNKIRSRAGLAATTATTQADVRIAIANERRLELALEGQRWFDLARTDATGVEEKYDVFPIPTAEIFASGNVITQNEAY